MATFTFLLNLQESKTSFSKLEFLPVLYINLKRRAKFQISRIRIRDADWLNFIQIRLASRLRKREDQALISIFTILKFPALYFFSSWYKEHKNFFLNKNNKYYLAIRVLRGHLVFPLFIDAPSIQFKISINFFLQLQIHNFFLRIYKILRKLKYFPTPFSKFWAFINLLWYHGRFHKKSVQPFGRYRL